MLVWRRQPVAQAGQPASRSGPQPVTVAAAALLAVQLTWMAALLAHSYFRQDDYRYLDRALTHSFSWSYLTMVDSGHLLPAGFAIAWVMARVSLYNWPLTCATILMLMAAAGLAALRMLRTLFGSRPAILIPLALYLFSPLTLAPVAWWAVSLEVLPLATGIFMAVDAHVRYLRGGRFRSALAAAGWLLLGMAGMDKGAVVPLLLFALTAAFFVPGRLPAAALLTARRYWRVWLLYGGLLAAYCAVFFSRLPAYVTPHPAPLTAGRVLSFATSLVARTLVPGALGGPWRWAVLGAGSDVFPAAPAALEQLAWALALVIVIASCVYRSRAWRAWAILFGWVAAADVAPVVIGRLAAVPPGLLGMQQRYVTDTVPVLALCVGLAFLPLAGERDGGRARLAVPARAAPALGGPAALAGRAAAALVLTATLSGAFWSLQTLESVTNFAPARSYIATARAAVAEAPRGTLIMDGPTPAFIMNAIFFHPTGYTSYVIGAMARGEPSRRLRWVESPHGLVRNLMIFDSQGRLWPAGVAGLSSGPPHRHGCWDLTGAGVPLARPLFAWGWTVRLDYSGPATLVSVALGGHPVLADLPAGHHSFYIPVQGSGQEVSVVPLSAASSLCLTGVTVGTWRPVTSGHPVPAAPVAG